MNAPAAQVDYFSFGESVIHYLPDGMSYVSIRVMNEGQRRTYQNKTSRAVDIDRGSEKMSMMLMPVEDMHALIETAVEDWNLVRGGDPVPFSPANLRVFLENTDPRVVDGIAEAIREANPWMLAEAMTVEAVDDEIRELQKKRAKLVEIEAGNGS